jgi:hypothetical protein
VGDDNLDQPTAFTSGNRMRPDRRIVWRGHSCPRADTHNNHVGTRPRLSIQHNLSSRAQPRDLASPRTPAHSISPSPKMKGAPSFRVLCGKVGTRISTSARWEGRHWCSERSWYRSPRWPSISPRRTYGSLSVTLQQVTGWWTRWSLARFRGNRIRC